MKLKDEIYCALSIHAQRPDIQKELSALDKKIEDMKNLLSDLQRQK